MPDVKAGAPACLGCCQVLSGSTGVGTAEPPRPGDRSICAYCGYVSVWADDMSLRQPTDEELRQILIDPDVARARAVIRRLSLNQRGRPC